MAFKIIISELASSEITESIVYYESRQKGLGKLFFKTLKLAFSILKSNLELFALKRKSIFREMPVNKFPFVVIYEIAESNIIIYSVFHTSKNPNKKPL
ncbi:MAG TPA: type II toxin-antitoxin system RelE/ParE family toxin [Flavobacterium sp.]|nr:type II toxin-antitoxin system RelE/ParE family toxin [Flavobacterium sp.]